MNTNITKRLTLQHTSSYEKTTGESAQSLLKTLLTKREAGFQGRGKYHPPTEPDTNGLPDLPTGWVWASPDQLSNAAPYSLCIGPFGSNLKVSDYQETGTPLIFVRNKPINRSWRQGMFKPIRILLITITVAALVVGGCFWTVRKRFESALESALGTKLDPKLYSEVVAQRQAQGNANYNFLPKHIPADAEAVSFVHTPGFLQGGDSITLRVRLPAERIREILHDLEQSGRQEVSDFTPAPPPRCYPKFGMTPSDIKKGHVEDLPALPPGFRIFLHQTDLKDIEKNWNHNFLAFTAVSVERGEVVYHVDRW